MTPIPPALETEFFNFALAADAAMFIFVAVLFALIARAVVRDHLAARRSVSQQKISVDLSPREILDAKSDAECHTQHAGQQTRPAA